MKRILVSTLFASICAGPASADWVVFKDGSATQVLALELADRAVHLVTLEGKRWSVLRDAVDVDGTRYANSMGTDGHQSPGWQVFIDPPPASPPSPPPPPQPEPERVPVVEILAQPPPRKPPPAPEPVLAPAGRTSSEGGHRFALFLNAAVGTKRLQFGETRAFELFSEQALIDSLHRDSQPRGVELGAHYRIRGPVGVGAAVELFESTRDAFYFASLPHPFFFDRFRELSGAESNLTHEETAFHLDSYVTKTFGPLSLDVFGGPSWFVTKTEVLVDVLYDEVFPFNDVVPRGAQARLIESRPIGFNVGASATYRLGGIFGVDLGFRYSRADMRLELGEGRSIDVEAGGLRLGAGLRFLFP